MKKPFLIFIYILLTISMTGCANTGQIGSANANQPTASGVGNDTENYTKQTNRTGEDDKKNTTKRTENIADMKMNVQIGDVSFTATLEDNAATRELIEMMRQAPVSIDMSDYSGFEKVGSLGRSLTTDNHQTTTHSGDIVLYNGNQIVIFYGSNSWSYTRLGKIEDLSGWKKALGSGDIAATFSIAE